MSYVSAFAVYFVLWWIVLFAVLPFGLKTQDDEGETILGTVSSAPRGPHILRAVLWTTVVSALIFGMMILSTRYFGLSFEDIPRIVPDFK
jgi:predicted secreted protein